VKRDYTPLIEHIPFYPFYHLHTNYMPHSKFPEALELARLNKLGKYKVANENIEKRAG